MLGLVEKLAKFKSKYYLKKEIDIIMLNLYEIYKSYELFRIISSGENHKYICNSIPHSMKIILNALLEKVLIGLSKLLCDKDEKSITILDIIELYNKNKELFNEKKYYYAKDIGTGRRVRIKYDSGSIKSDISKLKNDLNNNQDIIDYLYKRRNKSLAHNDKKYKYNSRKKYTNKKVLYGDIEKLINVLIEDMNSLSRNLFGLSYAFADNEKEEIEFLTMLIKNSKK